MITDLRSDFKLYASKYLWIINADRQLQLLTLNNVQERIHEEFEPRINKGRVFMYVLKARQEGVSTYSEGRIFHSAHLYPNTKCGVFADETGRAENIFRMSRIFYERLPDNMRPMARFSSKRELLFENPSKHGRFSKPGLKSSIEVFTAGNTNVGRSWTLNCCHLSEFAFYPNGPEIIDALIPTLPKTAGSFAILETTADRAGSFAHDEWIRYKKEYEDTKGNCELLPIFLPWWEFPRYSTNFLSEDHKKEFRHTLDEEEKALIARFSLTYEQLLWRREQIRVMRGDLISFRHEYPCDDEECWIFAGIPVFSREALARSYQTLPEKVWKGEIMPSGRLTQFAEGRLEIYKTPDPKGNYVIGVDPSGGINDNSVICVIDGDTLEQVAEWVGRVNGIELAQYLLPLGMLYGGVDGQALLGIEITGGFGIATQNELLDRYWNLYRWPRFDTVGSPDSTKLGWETNIRTKPLLVDFGQFCFNNDYATVRSEGLLKEMARFVRDDSVASASGNYHDDRVMAWLIALFVGGKGRTQEMFAQRSRTIEPVKHEQTYDWKFGRTMDTMCDMDYLKGMDADDFIAEEASRNWMSY